MSGADVDRLAARQDAEDADAVRELRDRVRRLEARADALERIVLVLSEAEQRRLERDVSQRAAELRHDAWRRAA
jgi:hypothetical protein